MRLADHQQCREIESLSERVYELSPEILMESAGALATREIIQSYFPELKKGECCIVCGPGHNGGDGWVVARHLHSAGYRNLIVMDANFSHSPSSLSQLQKKRAELLGIRTLSLSQSELSEVDREEYRTLLANSALI
ncbi:MAG: hypothetical protein KDD22_06885, partial [Bdellovibrionales bacterium]|nr:hypothetical protein [Bdellovibrionales bacterium]